MNKANLGGGVEMDYKNGVAYFPLNRSDLNKIIDALDDGEANNDTLLLIERLILAKNTISADLT